MNPRLFYLLCLRAYPAAFRARHGAEMLRIFEAEWRAARLAGPRATLAFVAHVFSDLARTVPHECLAATTHAGWLAFGTATFCGVTATWIQFLGGHREPSATAVVLFAGTVFFSYFAGVRTWRWPVNVAAWLTSAYLFKAFTDGEFTDRLTRPLAFLIGPLLIIFGCTLAVSLAGTGVGRLLRRFFPLRPSCGRRDEPATNKNL